MSALRVSVLVSPHSASSLRGSRPRFARVKTRCQPSTPEPQGGRPASPQGTSQVGLLERFKFSLPVLSSSSNGSQDDPNKPAPPPGEAFLSRPRTREVAFGSLSVTSTLLGVLAIFSPNLLCYIFLGGTAPELELIYTRIVGFTMACSAFAEGALADAAANNRLESATYQRLMSACMVKSGIYMATVLLHPGIVTPNLLVLFLSVNSVAIGIHYTVFQQTNKGKGPPFPWTDPTNTPSVIYTIIGALYVITACSCTLPPSSTAMVFSGKITMESSFLQHLWIPGYLLAAAHCYILKDAAERGRLYGGTFRRLNLGLCLLELGFSIQLGAAMAAGLAPLNTANYINLAVSQLIAAYMGWQWRFAVKPDDKPGPPAVR